MQKQTNCPTRTKMSQVCAVSNPDNILKIILFNKIQHAQEIYLGKIEPTKQLPLDCFYGREGHLTRTKIQ